MGPVRQPAGCRRLRETVGLWGEGVAASNRFDPRAKPLAEWLRSRTGPLVGAL
jgi:hypothetical protein